MTLEIQYFQRIQKSNYQPNFFCSLSFWEAMDWKAVRVSGGISIFDNKHGDFVLPCLDRKGHYVPGPFYYSLIGMDKQGNYSNGSCFFPEESNFVDFNYIYDPDRTEKASGSSFRVFRKNKEKWPKRNLSFEVVKGPFSSKDKNGIKDLILKWLSSDEDKKIYCVDSLLHFIRADSSSSLIIKKEGKIVSWNVWDENYKYINYRWCVVDPDENFLSEFSRYLVHSHLNSPFNRINPKLINDGGCLDSPGLMFFKDRMNPVAREKIYRF